MTCYAMLHVPSAGGGWRQRLGGLPGLLQGLVTRGLRVCFGDGKQLPRHAFSSC